MSLIQVDWKPDTKKLRQFAVIWLVGFGVFGCVAAWKAGVFHGSGNWTAPCVFWALAVVVGVAGLIAPEIVRPIYVGWMAVGLPIGYVVSHVLFGLLYFVMFSGVALVFRLIGRDKLHRQFDKQAKSYWIKRPPMPQAKSYFNQF
jgi:saxitoxin biosynthesis operon SxtJ-like protein